MKKSLDNKAHRANECTELNVMYRGADVTKSDGDEAYRFLITFGINALGIKLLKMCASKLRRSMAPTVPP